VVAVSLVNADFTADASSVALNDFITFTDASTCGANTWAWNFGESATPATADKQGPHSVTYNSTGLKTISLTVNGNTTETKTGYINVLPGHATTIAPEYRLKGITIYPNPAKGLFSIVADKLKYPDISVTITNISGAVVFSRECKGESEYLFDLSKSPQGTYFVKIKTDKELVVTKLVIIK
jgi:PKD repeat protein